MLASQRGRNLHLASTVLDEGRKRGLMELLALRRSNAELGSGTRVVESISVECEQDLPGTPFGELRHALCDVFLFESAS